MDNTLSWVLGIFGIVVLTQQVISAIVRAQKQREPDVYILDRPKDKEKKIA